MVAGSSVGRFNVRNARTPRPTRWARASSAGSAGASLQIDSIGVIHGLHLGCAASAIVDADFGPQANRLCATTRSQIAARQVAGRKAIWRRNLQPRFIQQIGYTQNHRGRFQPQLAPLASRWSAPFCAARAARPVSVITLAKARFGAPTTYPKLRSHRSTGRSRGPAETYPPSPLTPSE